jgi:GDPmannose 4,6-dehydratase
MSERVLVTGITGQVGSYLAEHLIGLGYEVHGMDRRKSVLNRENISHLEGKIKLVEGDITDCSSIMRIIRTGKYSEVYNLAAQSHVKTSFEQPMQTMEVNSGGVANIVEAIRWGSPESKLYQASSSELFGSSPPPQNESTPFHPRSPYAVSKLSAHTLVVNYRESYGLKFSCGIMFNTESPRRGKLFVTRKIAEWAKAYAHNLLLPPLELGNLDAKRDWTHVLDSIDAIYRVCNQDKFNKNFSSWNNYCFVSGEVHSVREFLSLVLCAVFGLEKLESRFEFSGKGLDEVLWDKQTNRICVLVNKAYFRPAEVVALQCDSSLIQADLGWNQKYNLMDIVRSMVAK